MFQYWLIQQINPDGLWGEEIMKALNKEKRHKEYDQNKHLTCPRCGTRVPYHRRVIHKCFRAHLKEMEMEISRMGWVNRAG